MKRTSVLGRPVRTTWSLLGRRIPFRGVASPRDTERTPSHSHLAGRAPRHRSDHIILIGCLTALLSKFAGGDNRAWADAPTGRYAVGANTVKDNRTGLTWQRATSSTTYTQPQAVNYCQELVLASFDDWRLPTVNELLSLVDPTKASPAIDGAAFTGTPSESFWTATAAVGASGFAWYVSFADGSSNGGNSSAPGRARCVR